MTITKATWPLTTTFHLRSKSDTNPDYQRPSVWSVSQKQLLMDTILRGYDIPKLYLRKVSTNPDKYEVVDGQQRLRSIWSFMNNEFALPKDSEAIQGIDVAGKKYSELDMDVSMLLDMYTLDCAIITDSTEEEVKKQTKFQ